MIVRRAIILVLTLLLIATLRPGFFDFQRLDDSRLEGERNSAMTNWLVSTIVSQATLGFSTTSQAAVRGGTLNLQSSFGVSVWAARTRWKVLLALAVPRDPDARPAESQHAWGPFQAITANLPSRQAWLGRLCGFAPALPVPPPADSQRACTLSLPIWAPVLAFGIYPALSLWRGPVRRVRRRALGLCRACGYDLAGVVVARCPECGIAFSIEGRAFVVARRRQRGFAATQWCGRYRTGRVRRWLARMTFALIVVFLALWLTSYARIAVRTPFMYCRFAWGLATVFIESASTRGEPAWRFQHVGFQGYGTIGWPPRLINWKESHFHLPLWFMACISAGPACVLYRPDLHWRARRRRKGLDGADTNYDSCLQHP